MPRSGSVRASSSPRSYCGARLLCTVEPSEQVGSRRVEVLVAVQLEPLDDGEAGFGPFHLGDGDCAVQFHDRRPGEPHELAAPICGQSRGSSMSSSRKRDPVRATAAERWREQQLEDEVRPEGRPSAGRADCESAEGACSADRAPEVRLVEAPLADLAPAAADAPGEAGLSPPR
jgi:hypothetical protein